MYDMYKHDREDTNGQTNKVKAKQCVCVMGVCVGGGIGVAFVISSLLNEIKKKEQDQNKFLSVTDRFIPEGSPGLQPLLLYVSTWCSFYAHGST